MIDQTGVSLPDGRGIRWDEVATVSAYKIDAIHTTDTYLTFDTEYGEYLEIMSEEAEFQEVMAALDRFLNLPEGWRARVEAATPDEDPIQLWSKEKVE